MSGRVWITGIGVVSPLGRGAGATMDRLVAGDRALGPLALFELPGGGGGIAAEIAGLSVAEVAPEGEAEGWSRTDAMSVIAAREALAQAGIAPAREGVDLILGGSTAGMFETEAMLAALSRDPDRIAALAATEPTPESLATLRRMIPHPLSSTADRVHAAAGPFRRRRSVCSACSSGANAVLLGASWIQRGRSRAVLAGGADGLCRLTYAGFGALSALSAEPCRPFDRRRNGLNLGEGAAFLLLEDEASARARGARPIAELRGFAVGAEAHHITNPEADGATAARVMGEAIARAGISPAEIDYVNAHGTATPLNDAMEAAAIARCFGREVERVPVSSSKGQIGHTLAAAGAIEAAITAMAIDRGVLPPTRGLEEIDPGCPLVHVTEARPAKLQAAISNSFGFGGTDAVLLFAHPDAFGAFDAPGRSIASVPGVVVTGGATVGPLGVLEAKGSLAYLASGPAPAAGAIGVKPADHLDAGRARRMDRAARLCSIAVGAALREGSIDLAQGRGEDVGAVGGSAFGSVDGSTAFLRRLFDKGARFASPADFPNLVPSSPIGHASIYLGLRGPVISVSELDVTAEGAIATAVELIDAGLAGAVLAGSVEEASALVEACLGPVCTGILDRGARSEGASALLLESSARAAARGARVLARVAIAAAWSGDGAGAMKDIPAPEGAAAVILAREDARADRVLAGSPWAEAPRRSAAPRAGDHEGAGGFAAAAAVAAIAAGELASALLLGISRDRGYAIVLTRAEGP
jgi:3-oxoacyl-[acyl-carrier-protein] synthase II